MIELKTNLNSFILGDRYFWTDGRKLKESAIPHNRAYKQVENADEWFFASDGWRSATEVNISYDDWSRDHHQSCLAA